jgi:hypothetical protein
MNIQPSVRALLLSIMREFPEAGRGMKARARELRSVEFSTTEMMEEFARETQRAIRSGNDTLARSYLSFASASLRTADATQREYIAVYFVEGLLLGLNESIRPRAWELMPENLRALHVGMWGRPTFSEG